MVRTADRTYRLDSQVGFLLRQANQRHRALFSQLMADLPVPTQFSALVKLREVGPLSQNELGRRAAMDSATVTGVINRLQTRRLVATSPDPQDARRRLVSLTPEGDALLDRLLPVAEDVTELTLEPLTPDERVDFLRLLAKLADGVRN